jgi:hypothetical protein
MRGQLDFVSEQTNQNAHDFQEQPFQRHRQPDRQQELKVGKQRGEGRQGLQRGQREEGRATGVLTGKRDLGRGFFYKGVLIYFFKKNLGKGISLFANKFSFIAIYKLTSYE